MRDRAGRKVEDAVTCPARIPPDVDPDLRLCLEEIRRVAGTCLGDGRCNARVPGHLDPRLQGYLRSLIWAVNQCSSSNAGSTVSFSAQPPPDVSPDLRECLVQLGRCADGCVCAGSGSGSGASGSGGSGSGSGASGSGGSGSGGSGSGSSGSGGSGGGSGPGDPTYCTYLYESRVNCGSGFGLTTPTLIRTRCETLDTLRQYPCGVWVQSGVDPCIFYIKICGGLCTTKSQCSGPVFTGGSLFDDYPPPSVLPIDECCPPGGPIT